jgi:hypothetical protein
VLANTLIALSATTAVFALLDIFLSDDQKKRLTDGTLRVWNWLDEMKQVPLLDHVKRNQFQTLKIALITVFGIQFLTNCYFYGPGIGPPSPPIFALQMAFFLGSLWLGSKILLWTLRAATPKGILLRIAAWLAVLIPCFTIFGIAALVAHSTDYPDDDLA